MPKGETKSCSAVPSLGILFCDVNYQRGLCVDSYGLKKFGVEGWLFYCCNRVYFDILLFLICKLLRIFHLAYNSCKITLFAKLASLLPTI